MEQAYNVFLLLGGIGLFLFGISYMGKGLEQAAGDNLRVWLEKLTTSPSRPCSSVHWRLQPSRAPALRWSWPSASSTRR